MKKAGKACISIIVPTCRRPADLERCLERLVPQLPADGSCELLVSDDGDVTRTRKALQEKFPAVSWLQGPKKGPAANRNCGASASVGEWLLFVDDDVLPSAGFFRAYKEARCSVDASVGALEGATEREGELPSLLWEAPHNPSGGMLISCNFMIRREVYELVGRFDERFPVAAFEDTEFAARLHAHGAKVEFVPSARVVHPLRRKPGARKLAGRWEGNALYAYYQGASAFRIAWNLPWHVFRIIQSRFRGQPWSGENAKAGLLFAGELAWVVCLTPAWVRKLMRSPRSPFWSHHVDAHGPVAKYGF